jgi:hypothetical protein
MSCSRLRLLLASRDVLLAVTCPPAPRDVLLAATSPARSSLGVLAIAPHRASHVGRAPLACAWEPVLVANDLPGAPTPPTLEPPTRPLQAREPSPRERRGARDCLRPVDARSAALRPARTSRCPARSYVSCSQLAMSCSRLRASCTSRCPARSYVSCSHLARCARSYAFCSHLARCARNRAAPRLSRGEGPARLRMGTSAAPRRAIAFARRAATNRPDLRSARSAARSARSNFARWRGFATLEACRFSAAPDAPIAKRPRGSYKRRTGRTTSAAECAKRFAARAVTRA